MRHSSESDFSKINIEKQSPKEPEHSLAKEEVKRGSRSDRKPSDEQRLALVNEKVADLLKNASTDARSRVNALITASDLYTQNGFINEAIQKINEAHTLSLSPEFENISKHNILKLDKQMDDIKFVSKLNNKEEKMQPKIDPESVFGESF